MPAAMQVRQLRAELGSAQAATEAAAQLAGEWRQRAEQFDRDRQAAAANIRWVLAAGPEGRLPASPECKGAARGRQASTLAAAAQRSWARPPPVCPRPFSCCLLPELGHACLQGLNPSPTARPLPCSTAARRSASWSWWPRTTSACSARWAVRASKGRGEGPQPPPGEGERCRGAAGEAEQSPDAYAHVLAKAAAAAVRVASMYRLHACAPWHVLGLFRRPH